MLFSDLEKAYDNVCREKLWRVLFDYGVRGGLLSSQGIVQRRKGQSEG